MKKLLALLLLLLMMMGAALAQSPDATPITINGVRAAFFDAAGNYTPALKVNGLTYVPVESFSKATGVNVQLDGKIITLNNVPMGLFDENGNYLPPVEEAGVLYVPLLPFCKAAGLTAQVSEDGYFITSGEASSQPIKAEAKPETVKVPLSEHNFTQYFSVKFNTENFSNYQQNLRVGTSIVPRQNWKVDYVLNVTALTAHPYENVKFTAFNYAADYMKDTNIGGPYFSDLTMPQGGLLTKRETKNGSYLGYNYLSSSNPRILSTIPGDYGVRYVSGYMLLPYEEGMQALSTLYKRGESYMTQEKYQEAASLFKSLGDYENAKALAQEAEQKKKDKAAAAKAAKEEAEAAANHTAYEAALAALDAGDYETAIAGFESLIVLKEGGSVSAYKDSAEKLEEAKQKAEAARIAKEEADRLAAYEKACQLETDGDYAAASEAFSALGDYKDSAQRLQSLEAFKIWEEALALAANGNFGMARFTAEKYYDQLDNEKKALYDEWYFRNANALEAFNAQGTALYLSPGNNFSIIDLQFKQLYGPSTMTYLGDSGNGLIRESSSIFGLNGYLNAQGQWAISPQYSFVGPFHQGQAVVKKNSAYYVIDTQGNEVCKLPEKKGREYVAALGEGLVSFREKNLYGAVNLKGKVVIKAKYNTLSVFNDGYALASLKQKSKTVQTLLNSKGKEVLKAGKYFHLKVLNENCILAAKKQNGYTGIITPKGKERISIGTLTWRTEKQGDLIVAQKTNLMYGVYDQDLNVVVPFKWNRIQVGGNGQIVALDDGSGYQLYRLDNLSKPIIPEVFSDVSLNPASPYLTLRNGPLGWHVRNIDGSLIN